MTIQLFLLFWSEYHGSREAGSSCKMHITLAFTFQSSRGSQVLWCATLLLEHVIVWRRRLHFSFLSQRDSGVWGGREGRGRGFAPRSVFSKCLWSNQVPRRRRRRCRRTELIAGKVFLTFASNHSSLLISIIYFSLPLHILPLTNLFHQLFSFFFSSLPSCLPLPAGLMSNSLQDGATASSHAGFPRNARKKKLPRYQGTFICPWMTLGCVTQGGVCSSQCVAHTLRYRPKNKKRRECFIKYLFKCKRRIRILFRWLFMGLSR